ncbi:MAG: TlpA family protein disulfide reductase [Phycisphaerales bacterium]|nr:MAG: TlpA family protein disulfide reductase [Phycisphaerales bacterium]
MHLRILVSVLLCLAVVGTAYGQRQNRLGVGDTAPGLDIEKWLNGSEVAIQEGKVYVIDFWATWCKPCRATIPHFNELHEQYGDEGLVIIGVSKEESATVERFVRKQGSKMSYLVAIDRRESTWRAWMDAAGRDTIPTVFVIDRSGKIQFVGNPHEDRFDPVLRTVLDGRFNAELARQVRPMADAAANARKMRNWRMCFKLLDDIIQTDPHVFAFTTLEKFEVMMVDQNDAGGAYEYARKLLEDYADDPGLLEGLARKIATDPKIKAEQRDLEIAMQAANQMGTASGKESPKVCAVQALIHYHAGRLDEAISLQKKAYFMARPKQKPGFKRVLRDYQEAAQREQIKAETGG